MMDQKKMAGLVKLCAQAMDDADRLNREAGDKSQHPVAGGPTTRGREICDTVCSGHDAAPWSELIYLLLAYTWNDALDWAERNSK